MIRTLAVSVTDTPVALAVGDSVTADGMVLWIHNHDHQNSHEIYVGDANVSASTGFGIQAEQTLGPIGLAPGEVIYGVSEQALGVACRVLATRT